MVRAMKPEGVRERSVKERRVKEIRKTCIRELQPEPPLSHPPRLPVTVSMVTQQVFGEKEKKRTANKIPCYASVELTTPIIREKNRKSKYKVLIG